MTLTLDVKPETADLLRELAAARGVEVGAMVDALAEGVKPEKQSAETEEARLAAVRGLRGRLQGSGPTVDDFLRERHEEARREAGL